MGRGHVCIPMNGWQSPAPPPDDVEATLARARARAAAMNRAVEQLAGLKDEAQRRRRVLDDLARELGG
jgi:hypothetical protein